VGDLRRVAAVLTLDIPALRTLAITLVQRAPMQWRRL
jgi:hypothetical protein